MAESILTVGELKQFLEDHNIADDTQVWVQRDPVSGTSDTWHGPCPGATVEIATGGYMRLNIEIGTGE